VITDELLTVASDSVEAICDLVQPRPSGKVQLRLLAWVVADARGAVVSMDKPLAETVGKRLDRQARKVRAEQERATEDAQQARDRVHALAGLQRMRCPCDPAQPCCLPRPCRCPGAVGIDAGGPGCCAEGE